MTTIDSRSPIGVIDSGVGGLTTVKQLAKLLPDERLVYCGDNGNAPYGNRSGQEIVDLTTDMLEYLRAENVKMVAVACNTISSTLDSAQYGHYEKAFGFPVLSIIRPTAADIVKLGYKEAGVIATAFTIATGCYGDYIDELDPSVKVYGEPSKNLAELIEKGDLQSPAIREEVRGHVTTLLSEHPVRDIVLGCTHYPIVQGVFESFAPEVNFINPAHEQAFEVQRLLSEAGLLNTGGSGALEINASTTEGIYRTVLAELEIDGDFTFRTVDFAADGTVG